MCQADFDAQERIQGKVLGVETSLFGSKSNVTYGWHFNRLSNDNVHSGSNQTLKNKVVKLATFICLLYQNPPLWKFLGAPLLTPPWSGCKTSQTELISKKRITTPQTKVHGNNFGLRPFCNFLVHVEIEAIRHYEFFFMQGFVLFLNLLLFLVFEILTLKLLWKFSHTAQFLFQSFLSDFQAKLIWILCLDGITSSFRGMGVQINFTKNGKTDLTNGAPSEGLISTSTVSKLSSMSQDAHHYKVASLMQDIRSNCPWHAWWNVN